MGTTIYVDIALSPTGPWRTVVTLRANVEVRECNTYYASLMPWHQQNGSLVVALSDNAWDMHGVVFDNPSIYRNSFFAIALPRCEGSVALSLGATRNSRHSATIAASYCDTRVNREGSTRSF